MLFRNIISAELFELDEVNVIFDCALAYIASATNGRDISIDDVIDAVKSQCEDLLQDAISNAMRNAV